MPDIFDSVKRSEIMRRVPSSGSRPELKVQAALDAAGIRYLHHPVDVPGKPDFLIPSAKTAAYMHGCFWHGHSCKRGARLPKTNQDYWQAKIARNVERDESNRMKLEGDGWQVIVIWECDLEEGTTTLLKTLANALQPVTNFGTTHKQDEGL